MKKKCYELSIVDNNQSDIIFVVLQVYTDKICQ